MCGLSQHCSVFPLYFSGNYFSIGGCGFVHLLHHAACTRLLATAGAHWVKKGGKSIFGYKQHIVVGNNDLVMAVETAAAN